MQHSLRTAEFNRGDVHHAPAARTNLNSEPLIISQVEINQAILLTNADKNPTLFTFVKGLAFKHTESILNSSLTRNFLKYFKVAPHQQPLKRLRFERPSLLVAANDHYGEGFAA